MIRYDNIPEAPLHSIVTPPHRETELFLARRAVRLCAYELGCHEVYNYSFVPDVVVDAVGAQDLPYARLANPCRAGACAHAPPGDAESPSLCGGQPAGDR